MSWTPDSEAAAEFLTTRWSDIQAARTSTPEHRQAVLDNLARRYWKPVYWYLRAQGHREPEARDITQDFFVEVVLGRDLFAQADPERGRFRAYLLHCLKNFLRDRHRRERARGRSPEELIVSIDQWADSETSRCELPARDDPPDEVFHHQWAVSLLEEVLANLRTACEQSGLGVHLDIFYERVVRPALEHVSPVSLEELARRHRLTSKQAANRGETVRRRFRKLLLDEVRLTVADESEAEEELRSLLGHLRRQGS